MIESILTWILAVRGSTDEALGSISIGAGFTAGALLNVVLLLSAVAVLTRYRVPRIALAIWLPYLGVATASILWSGNKVETFRSLLITYTYAAMFVIPMAMPAEFSRHALKIIQYSCALPFIYGTIEFVIKAAHGGGRVQATFDHPNVFAYYIVTSLALFLIVKHSKLVNVHQPYLRCANLFVLLGLFCLVGTQTRTAWIAVFILGVIYAALVNRRLLFFLPLLPALLLVPAVSDRFSDLNRGADVTAVPGAEGLNSYAWRELMWQSALADGQDTAILGKGIGTFGLNSPRFFPLADHSIDYDRIGIGAHSVYIQTIYELGYVGLLAYLAMFFRLGLSALKYLRYDRRSVIIFLGSILGFMVENYSDNMLAYGSVNMYFWSGLACCLRLWMAAPTAVRVRSGASQRLRQALQNSL